jgi:hypothetical protein
MGRGPYEGLGCLSRLSGFISVRFNLSVLALVPKAEMHRLGVTSAISLLPVPSARPPAVPPRQLPTR